MTTLRFHFQVLSFSALDAASFCSNDFHLKCYHQGGLTYPGTGSILNVLSSSTGRTPTVLGKPHQTMLDCIVDKWHLDRGRTCMVGDRLDTDIAFGQLGGLTSLLVLTGVTKLDQLSSSSIQPDYMIESLGCLLDSTKI